MLPWESARRAASCAGRRVGPGSPSSSRVALGCALLASLAAGIRATAAERASLAAGIRATAAERPCAGARLLPPGRRLDAEGARTRPALRLRGGEAKAAGAGAAGSISRGFLIRSACAGVIASTALEGFLYPLDTLKTRVQTRQQVGVDVRVCACM